MIDIEKNRNQILFLLGMVHRDGIDKLTDWLQSSDFFTAPASSRYHLSEPGGLAQHSLNVYRRLVQLAEVFMADKEQIPSPESLIIVSLLHDLCKVEMYLPMTRKRKVGDNWESYETYGIDERFCFGGHGSKSVHLVERFMTLYDEEAAAINAHMGCSDGADTRAVFNCYSHNALAWMLHVADEAATVLDEQVQEVEV